jgi:hypothetical protein
MMAPEMRPMAPRGGTAVGGAAPDFSPIINNLSTPRSVYAPQMTILMDRRGEN